MILLRNLILETHTDLIYRDFEEIQSKVAEEFHSGQTYQSWHLVPARLLKLTWLTFVKYGRVNEKALDKIWDITKENAIKILINSDIKEGHAAPMFFYKDDYEEITEEEWDRWFRFVSDKSGSKYVRNFGEVEGNARYSDRGRDLFKLLNTAYSKVDNPEEHLIAIDHILNFVHGLGDMAKWFVEGGWKSLEDLSDAPVKGIHLKGKLTENVFYRGDNDSGKKIDEPFTAAKELGAIFASENPSSAKMYGPKITQFTAKPNAKILRYDKPEFWKLLGRKRPPNNWIGSVAKHGKEKLIDVVNLLTRIAYKRGYDAVVFSPTDDIGTMIFNKNAFIKSEPMLQERRLDLSKKEDAAEYVIRQVWRQIPTGEEKYNLKNVLLWLDNEYEINIKAIDIAKKFYPDSDEPLYDFYDDLKQQLEKMEVERLERRRRQTPSLKDPLYLLKQPMVGKSWNQAKKVVSKMFPGWTYTTNPSDEDAEIMFNRLYRNAMGETVYNKEEIDKRGYGRLSDLTVKDSDTGNHKQSVINMFLQYYFSGNQPTGKVRVWRGTNNPQATIRPGDFVTFDRGYSQGYMSGKWKAVVTDVIDVKDLITYKLDSGMTEFVYWPEGHQIKKYEGEIPTLKDFWNQNRFGI